MNIKLLRSVLVNNRCKRFSESTEKIIIYKQTSLNKHYLIAILLLLRINTLSCIYTVLSLITAYSIVEMYGKKCYKKMAHSNVYQPFQ